MSNITEQGKGTTRILVNGNLQVIISISTLLILITAALMLGRKIEEMNQMVRSNWCVNQQARWVQDTVKLNPTWVPADVYQVHDRYVVGERK